GKLPSDGTPNLYINFRTIESTLTFHFNIRNIAFYKHVTNKLFCFLPEFRLVDVLLSKLFRIVKAQSHHILFNTEYLKILQIHIVYRTKLISKLFFGTIDMCIVHVQTTHAHQSE